MITRTEPIWHTATDTSWQSAMSDLVKSNNELCELLNLDASSLPILESNEINFPVRIPRQFIARMKKGDLGDPLLLQVLAQQTELDPVPGYDQDPLGEKDANPAPGIIHKYHGRVLLIVSGACAIHCRYCFRRHFPYTENNPSKAQWTEALQYLRSDPSITEVILSGGDPLAANDKHLAWLTGELEAIPHLKRLRVHTRLPIVIPQRVTESLIEWLTNSRLQPVVVVHCNHANEIDADVGHALNALRSAGIPLLNQSVLLKGVNDSATALAALSERLFDYQVMPYYLHLLDKVEGAAHYDVSEQQAIRLVEKLAASLPGYLVPKLVREKEGENNKSPVF